MDLPDVMDVMDVMDLMDVMDVMEPGVVCVCQHLPAVAGRGC